jgi:hypothetical protein
LGEEIFRSLAYPEVEPAGAQQSAIDASSRLLATNLPLFPAMLPRPTNIDWRVVVDAFDEMS